MTDKLDAVWEAVCALGGAFSPNDTYERGFSDAINAALDEIEKLGGMDPAERRRLDRDELPNCIWRDAETPFAKNH